MSRILRRPMFRGGGKVDSYGTGIAAPLVPGYMGGGQIGGGIIYGKPMADGRFGFQSPVMFNAAELTMPTSNTITSGLELLAKNKAIQEGNVPMIPVNNTSVAGVIDEKEGSTDIEDTDIEDTDNRSIPQKIYDFLNPSKEKVEERLIENNNNLLSFDEKMKKIGITTNKMKEEEKKIAEERKSGNDLPPSLRNQVGFDPKTELKKETELEEGTQISAKDAIAENQALFAELLGADKARGQDISDMLLRFSGSGGDTVGEKFKNYFRAESAAGPSRSEKIKQTAAGLAINDYVAGKRSAEQIEKLKEVETFRQGLKDDSLKLSVNDSLAMAKAKGAKLTDKGINSDETTKALIQTKVGDTVDVFRAKIKFKDVEKKKDKLKIGYNLVDDKDGTTRIVLYDGANINIKGTIDEFWGS